MYISVSCKQREIRFDPWKSTGCYYTKSIYDEGLHVKKHLWKHTQTYHSHVNPVQITNELVVKLPSLNCIFGKTPNVVNGYQTG